MTTATPSSTCAFVLDIDGVFIKDKVPIEPFASRALQLLCENHVPFVFVTNGGGQLEDDKVKSMVKLFPSIFSNDASQQGKHHLSRKQMIVAHTPFADLPVQDPAWRLERRVLVVGGDKNNSLNIMRSYGFESLIHLDDLAEAHKFALPYSYVWWNPNAYGNKELQEQLQERILHPLKIDAVMVVDNPQDWQKSLQLLVDVIGNNGFVLPQQGQALPDSQIPLYIANPDVTYAGLMNNRMTVGAFVECLKHLYKVITGKNLEINFAGKPYPLTYKYAESLLEQVAQRNGQHISRIYGIGDNPLSDIMGANNAGDHWRSLLVKTGIFPAHKENDDQNPADHVFDNCLDAIEYILKQEGILKQ